MRNVAISIPRQGAFNLLILKQCSQALFRQLVSKNSRTCSAAAAEKNNTKIVKISDLKKNQKDVTVDAHIFKEPSLSQNRKTDNFTHSLGLYSFLLPHLKSLTFCFPQHTMHFQPYYCYQWKPLFCCSNTQGLSGQLHTARENKQNYGVS